MEKTSCEIICGATTTLAVKGEVKENKSCIRINKKIERKKGKIGLWLHI